MYQKLKQKLSRGSILAISLIILGLMLISALSFALVSIQERKASMGENISNQAYSTAETGVEKVMQAMKDHATETVDKLATAISGVTCTGGALVGTEGFKVQLKDANDAVIDCSTTADVALVRSVKSIGTVGGNQRAVEVAVAAPGDSGIGTCYDENDMVYIQFTASAAGGGTCPSGFTWCDYNALTAAARKGCLPDIGQYSYNASSFGCLSGGAGAYIHIASNTGNWGLITDSGVVCSGASYPKACCR